jgi:predicted NACHT family NTPase
MTVRLRTASSDATKGLATVVAHHVRPGDLLLLVGGLGAGKTTFAQGFALGLGIDEPDRRRKLRRERERRFARELRHREPLGEYLEWQLAILLRARQQASVARSVDQRNPDHRRSDLLERDRPEAGAIVDGPLQYRETQGNCQK